MLSRVLNFVSRLLALACVVLIPLALGAQDSAKTAAKASAGDSASNWDIFAGYAYLSPSGKVTISPILCGLCRNPSPYDEQDVGGVFSVAGFFNRYVGVQGEVGIHEYSGGAYGTGGNDDGFTTFAGGLILRNPGAKFTPWAHALVGGALVSGPTHNPNTIGLDLTLGGGLDYELNHHWAIRLVDADYEYMHPNFTAEWGGGVGINAMRLGGGIVYHAGEFAPPTPVTLSVSVNPASVFAGDSVTATAVAGNLDPKLNAIYSWSGTGLTGGGASAAISTAALSPGTYTVQATVKEGKPGKEGLKPWQSAEASASFTVKQFEPPTISCSVSPTTIKPGESATVTAVGVSPQSRPLTYSYTASAGTIQGNGNTAAYSSVGAPTGPVTLTCTVTDDKGQPATANTSLMITAPYVAPIPHTQALCSISFTKDKERPTRVDNEAKACLDEVAIDLQKQSDAKAILVGTSNAKEKAKVEKDEKLAKHNKHLKVADPAAERAVNTKDYLVTEKGIDASRISVATGAADGQTVEDYLVPAGADFASDVTGTTPVEESAVKVQPRKPLHEAHKKPAAAKKAHAQ
ncbi:MAG: hypothetical protein ABR991_08395 [Terracidiphilus sp.]